MVNPLQHRVPLHGMKASRPSNLCLGTRTRSREFRKPSISSAAVVATSETASRRLLQSLHLDTQERITDTVMSTAITHHPFRQRARHRPTMEAERIRRHPTIVEERTRRLHLSLELRLSSHSLAHRRSLGLRLRPMPLLQELRRPIISTIIIRDTARRTRLRLRSLVHLRKHLSSLMLLLPSLEVVGDTVDMDKDLPAGLRRLLEDLLVGLLRSLGRSRMVVTLINLRMDKAHHSFLRHHMVVVVDGRCRNHKDRIGELNDENFDCFLGKRKCYEYMDISSIIRIPICMHNENLLT